jgi:hypothetical protein
LRCRSAAKVTAVLVTTAAVCNKDAGAAIGFAKGNVKGAVTIPGTNLTIQVITGQ